jgi:hypothetical protein
MPQRLVAHPTNKTRCSLQPTNFRSHQALSNHFSTHGKLRQQQCTRCIPFFHSTNRSTLSASHLPKRRHFRPSSSPPRRLTFIPKHVHDPRSKTRNSTFIQQRPRPSQHGYKHVHPRAPTQNGPKHKFFSFRIYFFLFIIKEITPESSIADFLVAVAQNDPRVQVLRDLQVLHQHRFHKVDDLIKCHARTEHWTVLPIPLDLKFALESAVIQVRDADEFAPAVVSSPRSSTTSNASFRGSLSRFVFFLFFISTFFKSGEHSNWASPRPSVGLPPVATQRSFAAPPPRVPRPTILEDDNEKETSVESPSQPVPSGLAVASPKTPPSPSQPPLRTRQILRLIRSEKKFLDFFSLSSAILFDPFKDLMLRFDPSLAPLLRFAF